MDKYIAHWTGVEYNGQFGMQDLRSYHLRAENRQQAVDFMFCRIVNDDDMHLDTLRKMLNLSEVGDYVEDQDMDAGRYLEQELPFVKRFVDEHLQTIIDKGFDFLKNTRLLRGFIDRGYHISISAYEKSSVDKSRKEFMKREKYVFSRISYKQIPIRELSDIQILDNSWGGDPFYCFGAFEGWREDILDNCGILRPSRLSDEEIKALLRLDSKCNPDLKVDLKGLEKKVFLI